MSMFSDPDYRDDYQQQKIPTHVLLQNEEKKRMYNCQRRVGDG